MQLNGARVILSLAVSALATSTLSACSAQQGGGAEPQSAEIAGLAASFVGYWQIAKPDAEGVVLNIPAIACDDPLVITSAGADKIIRKSPKGQPLGMELDEIKRGIRWSPEDQTSPYSYIAEPKTADRFWLYTVNLGKADWDNPWEYSRCK